MDFSRRESMVLLVAVAVVFIICFAFTHWLASGVASVLTQLTPAFKLGITTWALVSPVVLVMSWGCYKRWQDVSGGGQQLALRLGAVPVKRDVQQRTYAQLLNVVEEIAIAAGISPPESYILNNESSINAFVAGNRDCTVLVLTKGAMDKLDKQEVRAVVAHEIAHIANDDLNISMKLLIALGGLCAISEVGRSCFKGARNRHNRDPYSLSEDHPSLVPAYIASVILGVFLCMLGGVFTFFGDILKAAFTRKRELLADAKAVQYTRDTWGLASALNKISQNNSAQGLYSKYSDEIAHMCIDAPSLHFLFPKWLATHPAMETRISGIERHFEVKSRKKEPHAHEKSTSSGVGVARTVVNPDVSNQAQLRTMNDSFPEVAILIAMMVQTSGNNEEKNNAKYQSTLKCYTNQPIPMCNADDPASGAKLEHALDSLLQLPAIQRQSLLDHLAELAEHDGIHMDAEKKMLEHVYTRLNAANKAA